MVCSLYTFFAITLATCGPTKPGMVAAMFDIPIRMPAYLGAMSRWLTLMPATANPTEPTERDRNVIAHRVSVS